MAKVGEGDQRWIVEQRQDGTNVHNWHWAEKDVIEWARRRLTQLLGSIEIVSESNITLQTTAVQSVTGEAFVNNRKNKLIPAYELEVQGSWKGLVKTEEPEPSAVEGRFHFPYIADENSDEDPELKVSTPAESRAQALAKQAFLERKEVLLAAVRTFVKEMQAGGPVTRSDAAASGSDTQAAAPQRSQAAGSKLSSSAQPKAKAASKAEDSGTRSLKLTERFYARPRDLYECFTDARRLQGFTQSPAKVEARVGGTFEIFGGAVIGTFTQLQEPTLIGLDWRFRNWEDSAVSKVLLTFEEPQEGTTILSLRHTSIPEADRFGNSDVVDNTRIGWQQQIFHKIKAVFGFGL